MTLRVLKAQSTTRAGTHSRLEPRPADQRLPEGQAQRPAPYSGQARSGSTNINFVGIDLQSLVANNCDRASEQTNWPLIISVHRYMDTGQAGSMGGTKGRAAQIARSSRIEGRLP